MGFLCPRMQQIHSTTLEYFCSNTSVSPQVLCCSCCRWRVGGGGNRGRGGEVCGFWLRVVACHVRSFSRSRCYFVVFPFILQSKEYRRNVPGNPTRKCVEKEVCKKKKERAKKPTFKKRGDLKEWTRKENDECILPKLPLTAPINSQIKVLIGMNVGLVIQINLDTSAEDKWGDALCVCVCACVWRNEWI